MIIKVRRTVRKKIGKSLIRSTAVIICSHFLAYRISTIADPVWWDCYKLSLVLILGLGFVIRLLYLCFRKPFFIDTEKMTIKKGLKGKAKKFEKLFYKESICQILLFIGTLEVRGGELKRKVLILDVPDGTVEEIKKAFMAKGK